MVRCCSHCSFALLIRLFLETNNPESFQPHRFNRPTICRHCQFYQVGRRLRAGLNALELRQQVTSQGDDNMTTNSQQPAEPVIVEPGTAATVENPVRLKGTGVPDAIVEVRTEDKLLLLKVRVWSDGTWSGNASENLPEGRNTISAVQTNNYGPSPASRSRSFVVE